MNTQNRMRRLNIVFKMGLNFTHALNKYLSQVVRILFTAVSVIKYNTPRLFYGILFFFGLNVSWLQLFLQICWL